MPVSTNELRLTNRAAAPVSPPQTGPWHAGTSPDNRFLAIPLPSLSLCGGLLDAFATRIVTQGNPTDDKIAFQWVSPPLNGAQTFANTDSATITIKGDDNHPIGGGHITVLQVHMRIVENAGTPDRGPGALYIFSSGPTFPTSPADVVFSAVFGNTVNAQDGDRICIELGVSWSSMGVPFDSDNHGPTDVYARDGNSIVFSKSFSFKDDPISCFVDGSGILLSNGLPHPTAPSCDNTILGG